MSLAHNITEKDRSEDVIITEETTFDSLLLSKEVLKGLVDNGFTKPSPIQLKAIPLGKCGFDLIVHSKSGTGKTLVFAVVALEMIDVSRKDLQVLIVAPTREIAVQIQSVIKVVGAEMKDLKVEVFIGGLPIEEDLKRAKSCQIAVGAPGRLQKLIEDGHLKLETCRLFVLDEADKLLDSNMQSDVNYMHDQLPKRRQTLAMSATYEHNLQEFVERYMEGPTFVSPSTTNPMLLGLKHFIYEAPTNFNVAKQMLLKTEVLMKIFTEVSFKQCLVFFNYQVRVENLHNSLMVKGWETSYISGAQKQSERLKAINDLKDFKCRILLSTDLTARGIDAANVDLVINYDIPVDTSTYLHRMGRAGRYGSKGVCINIATKKEIVEIQKILGEIGGKELTIQKLPNEKLPADLLVEPNEPYEVIKAVDNITPNTASITKSIWEMKNDSESTKKKSKAIKKQELIDSTMPGEWITVDTHSNDGSINEDTYNRGENILQNTIKKEETSDKDEMSKKRKRLQTPPNEKKSAIYVKNISMLNLGKLLIDDDYTKVNQDSVSAIIDVLKNAKAIFEGEKSKKSEEDKLSDNLGELTIDKNHTHAQFNILQLAYEKALDKTQLDWFEFVKEPVIKDRYKYGQHLDDSLLEYWPTYNSQHKNKKIPKVKQASFIDDSNKMECTNGGLDASIDSEEEEVDLDGMPDNVLYINPKNAHLYERNVHKVRKTSYNSRSSQVNNYAQHEEDYTEDMVDMSQWCQAYQPQLQVPAMPTTRTQQYQSYYDYYGQCLDQSVDTFSDVPTFEVWFDDWRKNLEATRNFVQRKIYMQEMNHDM